MSRKGRRVQGEGSVYEQRPGLWAAAVDLGWADGKRRRKYVYAKTEAEVVRKRDELRRRLQLGVDLTAPPRTMAAWLEEWLSDVKAHDGTRPSTLRRYREVINTHLIPAFGGTKLDKLTARQVQRFLTGTTVRVCDVDRRRCDGRGGPGEAGGGGHHMILDL